MLCARLIAGRVWFGLEQEIAAVKDLFEVGNHVYPSCAALDWLVQEFPRLAFEPDIPRVIEVARLVFRLVQRRDAYPDIRDQVVRLERFSSALEGANETWVRHIVAVTTEGVEMARRAGGACFDDDGTSRRERLRDAGTMAARGEDGRPRDMAAGGLEVRIGPGRARVRGEELRNGPRPLHGCAHPRARVPRSPGGSARVQKLLGQAGLAIEHYRKAVRTVDARVTAWNALAWNLATQGSPGEADLSEALWAARRAVAVAPRSPCWDTLAEVLGRQGDLPAAIAATRESIRLDPNRQAFRERMRADGAALGPVTPPSGATKDDKEIFDDTDFEVDNALSDGDSDDKTVQLEAASDSDLKDSDTGYEVFAIDEEAVDQNAATAMAPSAFAEDEEDEDDGFESAVSSEMTAGWSSSESAVIAERAVPVPSGSRLREPKRSLLERAGDFVPGRRETAGAEGNAKQTNLPSPITDRVLLFPDSPSDAGAGSFVRTGRLGLPRSPAYRGDELGSTVAGVGQDPGKDQERGHRHARYRSHRPRCDPDAGSGRSRGHHLLGRRDRQRDLPRVRAHAGATGAARGDGDVPRRPVPAGKAPFALEVGRETAAVVPWRPRVAEQERLRLVRERGPR